MRAMAPRIADSATTAIRDRLRSGRALRRGRSGRRSRCHAPRGVAAARAGSVATGAELPIVTSVLFDGDAWIDGFACVRPAGLPACPPQFEVTRCQHHDRPATPTVGRRSRRIPAGAQAFVPAGPAAGRGHDPGPGRRRGAGRAGGHRRRPGVGAGAGHARPGRNGCRGRGSLRYAVATRGTGQRREHLAAGVDAGCRRGRPPAGRSAARHGERSCETSSGGSRGWLLRWSGDLSSTGSWRS